MKVTRPALRYFGGKWNLAPWIISHFPKHDCYVEPFGGAASVLLRKPRAFSEVYNDLDNRVVNYFRVLRECPEELIKALRLTPYSREEYRQAHLVSDDSLEDARRFVILSGQGNRGAGTIDTGGWRWMRRNSRTQTPAHDWVKNDHLFAIAERFLGVQIENDTARAVIKRYDTPDTLFYVDPPYVHDTRSMRWKGDAYNCEMNDDQQIELADLLRSVQGAVVVSGYPSELYNDLYKGWIRQEKTVTQRVRSDRGRGKPSTECLWISPGAVVQPRLV